MLTLARYSSLGMIHNGAVMALYRGVRESDGVPVVIKVTKGERPHPRELASLRHEHAILRAIDWPGVIKAYELAPCGPGLALVLEDTGGEAVSDRLRGGALDLRACLGIAHALATILVGVHAQGVIHKDIKPANIVVGERPADVQLIDFGIATLLSQESHPIGKVTLIEGTIPYMAPEQTGLLNRAIDSRTDLYSLGVTIYEMLTGARPFEEEDLTDLMHSHAARIPAPPHERRAGIPLAVSAIVMKLLAKPAEDRYQQAAALAEDLSTCLAELDSRGRIEPFELGRRDIRDKLSIPQKLYGREAELAALMAAFDRASGGRPELVLVAGAAGAGKSMLVQEVQSVVAVRGGHFVAGKFDPLRRDVPFTAFTQAFRELIKRLLSEPAEILEARRAALLDALGGSGALLMDLLPELELVIGPQPAVPPAGPTEAQNRLGLLMQSFVHAFCSPSRPLVFFIDDLQWSDAASLWLLRLLTTDPEGRYIALVGAYRDSEVDGAHPLRAMLGEIRKQGVNPTEIAIGPLDRGSILTILGETLQRSEPARLEVLAGQLFAKTGGNPFFLSQTLLALHREGLLRLDRSEGKWTWKDAEIEAAPIADNVADLMAARLEQLAPRARRLISMAACVGHVFDLAILQALAKERRDSLAAALWPALREGLIVPLDEDYLLLPTSEDPGALGEPGGLASSRELAGREDTEINARYRFLHDRVEQAAYSLAPTEARAEIHLQIGRRLLSRALGEGARPEEVFEAAHQLNAGAAHLSDNEERRRGARLNLSAGRMAKAQGAYGEAAAFLAAGIEQAADQGWDDDYDLTFELHWGQAECEYQAGRAGQTNALIDRILKRARSPWQGAQACGLRVIMYASLARFSEAMDAGRAGLSLLGIELPQTPEEADAAAARDTEEIERILADRGLGSLLASPAVKDPEQLSAAQILVDLLVPSYNVDIRFWKVVLTRQTLLGMTRGHCGATAQSYVSYGFYLAGALGRYAESLIYGELGLKLAEGHGDPALLCKVAQSFATFAGYGQPLQQVLPHFMRARQLSLPSGELIYGSFACVFVPVTLFRLGEPLDAVSAEVQRSSAILKRIQNPMSGAQLLAMQQAAACLRGDTESPTSFSDSTFDEQVWIDSLDPGAMAFVRVLYFTFKTLTLFLHDRADAALLLIESAEQSAGAAVGHHWSTDLPFYASLVLAARYPESTPDQRPRILEQLTCYRAKLSALADACRENTGHRHALVTAEIARLEGRPGEAMDGYEQAITLAGKQGFRHEEAIANELYALFFLARGQTKNARAYMTDAHYGYLRWGATVKVAQIERKYPNLLPTSEEEEAKVKPSQGSTLTSMSTVSKLLDLTTAVRATQALSTEIVLDKLVQRLMRIVLAHAGAQRGFLVLERGGSWVADARFQVSPDLVESGLNTSLEAREDLAQSVVRYVARTHEPLVINSASSDPRFANDPYVRASSPQSVLAVALLHQGRCRGVLYLEHNRAVGAFTEERLELLQMLCAQAVISMENAVLYDSVSSVSAALRELNQHLEREIARRTEEISITNERLQRANERLERELEEREQTERARAALQEEVLRLQSALLEELSTPLIPITGEIMVLPLIGTIDARRAEAMMQAVLQGAQQHKARVVIIDVTGMKKVDAHVASTLLQTARALRLIGSEVVLTGMRPDVARTLVELGVHLGALVTRGTLQSGIAYAMGHARLRA